MTFGVRVGRLVMVDDDGSELACVLVCGDLVELTAPEVGEQHGLFVTRCDAFENVFVELVGERRFSFDAGAFEGCRRDSGTCQPISVDV
jgi:hypothetical protein